MDKDSFTHSFIFSSGHWTGEGKITLNMVAEDLFFQTHWEVQERDFVGKVTCFQDVLIAGLNESMRNELTFYNFQGKSFSVDMENPNLGRIVGSGFFDEETIAWEFRNHEVDFEGFESYALQPDGSYLMKGAYLTNDQLRTEIEARIWQKVESKESEGFEQDDGEQR